MKDLFELGLTSNRLTGIPHTFALLTQVREPSNLLPTLAMRQCRSLSRRLILTLLDLMQLRSLQVGGNMFPVEPSQQHLKTWEMTQKWLKINLQVLWR